jgi:hypothetical protein
VDYQKIYKFDNGYGASVVCGLGTYGGTNGLFEVAVLDSNGSITYNTPIAGDVIGWLDFADVADVLNKIKAL